MRGVIPEEDHQGSVQLPRWRQVEERAFHAKKVHTEHNETGRGDPVTGGGLHPYPTGIGEPLEFFLQQRSDQIHFSWKTTSSADLWGDAMQGFQHTPGFLGTPAGITTTSQPFRQSGSCSGPR